MKRVLKWCGVIILVVLIGGFGFVKWTQWYLLPDAPFNAEASPMAPDYQQDKFWAALPSVQDTADLIPPNIDTSQDLQSLPVDVFFVHSTGYVGPGGWNSTMDETHSERQSLQYMLSSMASAFNGCCQIYAPIYRQAHLAAFVDEDTDSSYKALDLAYQDVETAFDVFLSKYNQGRPFIIVAHSQGSLHALRLITNRIDQSDLRQQMVAAYTIGYWLPTDYMTRNLQNIGLCKTESDTGCIVSFDTYGEGGSLSQGYRHWYKSGWEVTQGKSIACVNPLSWSTNTNKADTDLHKGAFPVEFKRTFKYMLLAKNPGFVYQELPTITPNLTWAQCAQTGELIVERQQNNAFSNHLDAEDGSYPTRFQPVLRQYSRKQYSQKSGVFVGSIVF